MAERSTSLLQVLSRAAEFQVHEVAHFRGSCSGSLIRCTFDAHRIEIPPLDHLVLLAANAYRLKHALFDFGWGFRNHFSSHPHPLHLFPGGNGFRWNKDGWADVTLLTIDSASVNDVLGELGIDRGAEALWALSQAGFANPLVYHAIGSFFDAARQDCSRLLAGTYCTLVLAELARQRPSARPLSATVPKLPRAAMARVVEHVHEHLADDLSLDDLAAAAGLSKYHFLRRFKASTGSSPLRYVTQLRVAHAKRLLAGSSRAMDDIAASCGFGGADQLARAFRRLEGVAPTAYRAGRRAGY
ncbi:MAG: AraC family transcriptional regulator [Ramlibacter sp.]|jgi:AraC family transcriptional regulator|nr:AraC family transcriptional regulator [Ramlibacter sp.]